MPRLYFSMLAVRLRNPCCLLLGVVLAAPLPAAAQDRQADDELVVVGSRIARPDYEALSPVTVVDALELRLRGAETLADAMRESTYNSFGSYRERSGSSYGQVSLVDLRGLGANRTVVLINGRRVPGSPFTGTSAVDLNTIPLTAVERVEVLTDSASAVYGADAIGGVVNVVLKKDYDGLEVKWGERRPHRKGADSKHGSAVWGQPLERGHILAGIEYFEREKILDRDRAYSRAAVNGPTFGATEGISVGGNTGFNQQFTKAFVIGDCSTDVYAGRLQQPFGVTGGDGAGCGFAYADISYQTANLERKSFFLNASHELAAHAEAFLILRYADNDTEGRYAPAVGFFAIDPTHPINSGKTGDDVIGSVFHRFVAHGNRDDKVDLQEYDAVLGVEGSMANGWGYETSLQYYRYDAEALGNTYVRTSAIEKAVREGRYDLTNPFSTEPVHLAAVAETGLELTRDVVTEYKAVRASLDGAAFDIGADEAQWAFGFEYSNEKYKDRYDRYREAGDVLGSAGNSAAGRRSKWAAFGELALPLLERWDVSLAGRYDQYADFGSAFSPQILTRVQINSWLALRASWGEGFKAPDLTNLYSKLAESYPNLTDYYRCDALQIPRTQCPTFQVQAFTGGNPDLQAEDSRSVNAGLVLDAGPVSASIDYFKIKLSNAVSALSMQAINALEAEGDLPANVTVVRGASSGGVPGVVKYITSPYINYAETEAEGVDLKVGAELATDWADFAASLQWSRQLGDSLGTSSLTSGFPSHRAHGMLRMMRDGLTVSWYTHYISSFENYSGTGKYRRWLSHDITVDWQQAFGVPGLELTAGVRNLDDRGPSIDPVGGYISSVVLDLYTVSGRVPFLNLQYNFE